MTDLDLRGQARVISEIERRVDRWRGFSLGRATDPYPDDPARYQPVDDGDREITSTSLELLRHWFRHEPHRIGKDGNTLFKYWPHQRRLVETFIYLHEVRGIRRTQELYALAGVDPLGPQRDPWAKLGGQLATGSGKTKMMSLLVAWAYLNAVLEPDAGLGFGRHSVIIAPGLFVRDRLLQDFAPTQGGTAVFFADPVVPPALERFWDLKVYTPATCPLELDPEQGALVVTNKHQLYRSGSEDASRAAPTQEELFFELRDPRKLEEITSPLLDRFRNSRGLLVINDEAHGVKDEPEHARLEQRAREADADESISWIRSIQRLNGSKEHPGRVCLQIDLSATLFEETGSDKRGTGTKKKTKFPEPDLFRHTAVRYRLAQAIQDGIVKKPILERIEVRDAETGEPEPLVREGAPNAWEKYRNLMATGIARWKKVRDQLRDEGDGRKPILFVLCNNKDEAKEVANFLAHGEASRDDLSDRVPSGFLDRDGEQLFVWTDAAGLPRSTVVEIHIGKAQDSNEEEWSQVREAVNNIDRDEILDPADPSRRIANPYNVVVSVMMLKEGWDVRNVKVIVPLRPCDSRTLTEQTLGRGLRKMHPPLLDDEGGAAVRAEELFVMEHPSFQSIIRQIDDLVEQKRSDEIDHAREYVAIPLKESETERAACAVRLVTLEGVIEESGEWTPQGVVAAIPELLPRLPWAESLSRSEIQTYLHRALAHTEEQGQSFELDGAPSYRDFDHVIELAYARPLLDWMKAGYHHKNGVKALVRRFLERKVFAMPKGAPLAFDRALEPDEARLALGNLAREDVIERVKLALREPLHEALTSARRSAHQRVGERRQERLQSHQALRKNVIEAPQKCVFARVAVQNRDEERVARLLDRASDVTGWLYNDRDVAYALEYDWQGYTARYFPDFIARARAGQVFHNFIIEVKGRLDDRDKAKAQRGRRFCEELTQHDHEPWHYVMLIENEPIGRSDVSGWEGQSSVELMHLLARQERLPLVPGAIEPQRAALELVPELALERRYREGVPVYDLQAAAGAFSEAQAPERTGWALVRASRPLERNMFVARVHGRSMERDVPDGAWGLFRGFPVGSEPQPGSLDGRRVLVELRDAADADTGGRYTLKRWRVTARNAVGGISAVELRPDNPACASIPVGALDAVRVIGELVEVLG